MGSLRIDVRVFLAVMLSIALLGCDRDRDKAREPVSSGKASGSASGNVPGSAPHGGEQAGEAPVAGQAGDKVPAEAPTPVQAELPGSEGREEPEKEVGQAVPSQLPEPAPVSRILTQAEVLGLIPADARLALVLADYRSLLETLDLNSAEGSLLRFREMGKAFVEAFLGFNPVDPDSLLRLGLDPSRPMAAAVLSLRKGTVMFVLPISDRNTAVTWLKGKAGTMNLQVKEETVQDKVLMAAPLQKTLSLILSRDYGILIVADRGDAAEVAGELLRLTPDLSLAAAPGFKAATAGLEQGTTMVLYAGMDQIMAEVLERFQGRIASYDQPSDEDLELKKAIEEGAPEDRIANLKEAAANWRKWVEERKARLEAEMNLVRRVWEPVEALVLGLDLGKDGLAVAELRLRQADKGLWRELFLSGLGGTGISLGDGVELWGLADLKLDLAVLEELVSLAMTAEGEDWNDFKTELGRILDQDLGRVLPDLLTGEVGLAAGSTAPLFEMVFGADGALEQQLGKSWEYLDLSLILGVKDAGSARAFLEHLAGLPALQPRFSREEGEDRWLLTITGLKPLHLGLVGTRLVAATNPGLFSTLQQSPAAEAGRNFSLGRINLAVPVAIMAAGVLFMSVDLDDAVLAANEKGDEGLSETRKALLDRYLAKREELRKFDLDFGRQFLTSLDKLVKLVGPTGVQVKSQPGGLQVRVEHRIGDQGSLVQGLNALVEAGVELTNISARRYMGRSKLEQEYWKLGRMLLESEGHPQVQEP